MSTGIKKLQEEYKFIRKSGILASIKGTAKPVQKDFLHWFGFIEGPKNSPYDKGIYYFEMKITTDYPNKAPIDVRMKIPIYHKNISNSQGHICFSYLSNWQNTNDIAGIAFAIFDLLRNPNPGSPYNSTNLSKAREFNQNYAMRLQTYDWNNSWDKGWNF